MNARAHKRAELLPMTARILREKKHRYVVVIKFTQSKRVYEVTLVHALNIKTVKAQILREFPHMKWSKK
jgi:hypothetical protein